MTSSLHSGLSPRRPSSTIRSMPVAIVGREHELAIIDETLRAMQEGSGRLILVAGEAGIGKTRLADAAAERARRSGFQVAWGRCWESGGPPAYWPWVQVLRTILRDGYPAVREAADRERERLAPIIPELSVTGMARGEDIDPERARFLVFEAVTTVLRAVAAMPALIILDDLHAADQASLLLLRYVATSMRDDPIALLALYRDPELETDDPRLHLLGEMRRDPFATQLRPTALG